MAIKRITVEQSEKPLANIDSEAAQFGVKTELAKLKGRDACIAAESIIEAVDAHRAANRVPRQK